MTDTQHTLKDWKKEFREKMQNYTDGKSEFGQKGSGIQGFWLRSGMDGDIDQEVLENWIEKKVDQARAEGIAEGRKVGKSEGTKEATDILIKRMNLAGGDEAKVEYFYKGKYKVTLKVELTNQEKEKGE